LVAPNDFSMVLNDTVAMASPQLFTAPAVSPPTM
jgi:hypothetical protein